VGFGRKVRNLIQSEDFDKVFPGITLSSDSKAAGRWNTNKRGDYFAIGVGGAVTGKGADLLIIDDPHSEQEAQQAQFNPEVYDRVYEWYTSGPRQRLQPGGAIIIVMCMTGDTDVLMADGTQRKLRDVRSGDFVATYENGRVSAARVTNFQSSGVDNVFTIKTRSGRILRSNEDHPFLVEKNGERKWARLRHLRVGMSLVGLRDVQNQRDLSASQTSATHAKQKNPTIAGIRKPHINPWASMVSGRARRAIAVSPYIAKVCASLAIESNTSPRSKLLSSAALAASNIGTASQSNIIRTWWMPAVIAATSAEGRLPRRTLAHIGTENFVSTIATTAERFAAFCATTATSLLDTAKALMYSCALRSTYDFTADEIVEIIADGREEVFDVEVDRTENFIANGIVSHNTRWGERDLTGKILKSTSDRKGVDEWEVIEFPALMPSGLPLWPEFWSQEELEALKAELPVYKWNAQYQQNPTAAEGALIKREWWREWPNDDPPPCEAIIQSWDTAFLKTQRSDYSACTTWGVFYHPDANGRSMPNIILLDAYKEKLEFPDLKRAAYDKYREFDPDQMIVEKKASGAPLIFELRAMGIPVTEFTPSRGQDKIARVNAVTDLFASGAIWYPSTRWAEEVIEECAAFPAGEHDDFVDSTTQALLRFRQGGWVRAESDDWDDEPKYRRPVEYY
jgi:predicted phage terminase large subunit-like protein